MSAKEMAFLLVFFMGWIMGFATAYAIFTHWDGRISKEP